MRGNMDKKSMSKSSPQRNSRGTWGLDKKICEEIFQSLAALCGSLDEKFDMAALFEACVKKKVIGCLSLRKDSSGELPEVPEGVSVDGVYLVLEDAEQTYPLPAPRFSSYVRFKVDGGGQARPKVPKRQKSSETSQWPPASRNKHKGMFERRLGIEFLVKDAPQPPDEKLKTRTYEKLKARQYRFQNPNNPENLLPFFLLVVKNGEVKPRPSRPATPPCSPLSFALTDENSFDDLFASSRDAIVDVTSDAGSNFGDNLLLLPDVGDSSALDYMMDLF